MLSRIPLATVVILAAILSTTDGTAEEWQAKLVRDLPLLGHRNWIVIADSAYPAQSRQGIETVYIGGDQLSAVRDVLRAVEASKHVRAKVLLDAELDAVPETDAPGISAYRRDLTALLSGQSPEHRPHEAIIGQLDEAAKTFRILVLKTDLAIPYTSVFLQLDCGYWSDESEQRLRAAIKTQPKR